MGLLIPNILALATHAATFALAWQIFSHSPANLKKFALGKSDMMGLILVHIHEQRVLASRSITPQIDFVEGLNLERSLVMVGWHRGIIS